MRLLSQMHSSFRDVSGSLSARSSSSFYLLAPPVPLRLFLSRSLPSAFAELPAFYFTQHARTLPQCSLSLSSESSVFLQFPSQRGSDSCSFLAFTSSSLLPRLFFPPSFFYIIGAALFGLGHKRPRIGTTLWCWVPMILYNACNGCCDAPPDTLFPNVIYEGEMITRASVDDPFYQFA